jgi:hypothetical protein
LSNLESTTATKNQPIRSQSRRQFAAVLQEHGEWLTHLLYQRVCVSASQQLVAT